MQTFKYLMKLNGEVCYYIISFLKNDLNYYISYCNYVKNKYLQIVLEDENKHELFDRMVVLYINFVQILLIVMVILLF